MTVTVPPPLTILQYIATLWVGYFVMTFLVRLVSTLPSKTISVSPPVPLGTTPPTKSNNIRNEKNKSVVECYSPSTGSYLGAVNLTAPKDVDALCLLAKNSQKAWSKTTFRQRRQVLMTLQKYITSHTAEICEVCCHDSGKTMLDALMGEVLTTAEKISTLCERGEVWLEKEKRPVNMMMLHKTAYVEYVPLGVLGVIAPWNYPFCNFMNHILSGLFSGNGVVVKVSEHTSWSSEYFVDIVKKALVVCGHDPEVVQLLVGFGDSGAALVASPNVDKIIFTGSPNVGRLVMGGAAPHLKPVVLELGGKDPMIFCDDVTLSSVVPWAMRGVFQNCGQNCCGVERVFVYESIHDEFVATIVKAVKDLRQGATCNGEESNDIDCGAMVMKEQLNIIQDLVDDAVSKGAVIEVGGKPNTNCGPGNFYQPTVLTNVTGNMRISQEEVFGPVMCVVKVLNNDDDLCIEMVNDCPFGLGASCYSGDQRRAEKIGSKIRSGMFTANDFGVNYLIQSLPFGGVNESGFDRFAGPEGLRGCCLQRSVVVDRIPGVRTSIPPPFSYPIDGRRAMGFGDGLINLFYNETLWGKVMAVFKIIKNA